jgi:hypothetical protein
LNLEKLGRNDRILAIVGILAFVDSFLPWYSVSVKSAGVDGLGAYSASSSGNAWSVGFGAWFPLLLLLAIGVLAALPAFEQKVVLPGGDALLAIVALVATVIILIRWLTYPSVPDDGLVGVSAGASFGTYVGLVLGLVATAIGYLGFTASGGSLNNIGAAFQKPANSGQVPGPGYAPPVDYGQQAPYQQPQAPYQPPQAPYYQPPQDPNGPPAV